MKNFLEKPENKKMIEIISSSIINWYNQDTNPDNRLLYVRVMNKLKEIKDNAQMSGLENQIRNFISDTINSDILDKLSKRELNYFIEFYPKGFLIATRRTHEIFDKTHNLLPNDTISKIIIDLINSHPEVIPDKLKIIKYSVENPVQIVSSMLDKLPNLDPNTQEKYIDSLAKMKCGNDPPLIERFYNVLLGFKNQKPETVRKYSRRKFFNEAQRKSLQENL